MTHGGLHNTIEALFSNLGTRIYKPALNTLTGSPNATLLLCQIVFWWVKHGRRRFQKSAAPCSLSTSGDSWQEELGFTRSQFETARRKIACRITTGMSQRKALEAHMVVYWCDRNNRTWYLVNEPLLCRRIVALQSTPAWSEQATGGQVHVSMGCAGDPGPHPHSPPLAERLWKITLDELKLQMSSGVFSCWLAGSRALNLSDSTLRVAVNNAYIKDWLDYRLRSTIERTVRSAAHYLNDQEQQTAFDVELDVRFDIRPLA